VAVRIYSLAKELNLDSKELVGICNRIGITGKGSALASLDDEEIGRVKSHLANADGPKAEATRSPDAPSRPEMKRPQAPVRVGKPKSIGRPGPIGASIPAPKTPSTAPTRRSSLSEQLAARNSAATIEAEEESRAAESTTDEVDEVIADEAATEDAAADAASPATDGSQDTDVESKAAKAPTSDVADEQSSSTKEADTASKSEGRAASTTPAPEEESEPSPRADSSNGRSQESRPPNSPLRPGRRDGGKIRVIGSRSSTPRSEEDKAEDAKKRRKDRKPVINLASIPKAATPPLASKSKEPAAQKPEIKLTKDLIASSQSSGPTGAEAKGTDDRKSARKPQKGGLTEFKEAAEKALRGKGSEEEDQAAKKRKSGLGSRDERSRRRNKNLRPGQFDHDGGGRRYGGRPPKRKGTNTAAPRKENIGLELPCTVRSFSEAAGVPAARVLRSMMELGEMVNINAQLDAEMAMTLATHLGVEIDFKEPESLESARIGEIENLVDAPEDLVERPPIVTFLGHVDHGKTSLLDYLIGTRIVTGEAGGITQHIRAYQVEKDNRKISFVDTPGHEAFTEMRARGANVTDIAVLVVAAEDGIMPQTEEAISHAKAAGVPIVVAINKIDLEGADANRVMTQMTEHELTPSEWGGDVEVVKTSAITGEGMDELLETILTVAELHDYRANPKRAALGVCLESEQAASRGVMAKVVVRTGTLRVGDIVVCGGSHGRVKALYDTLQTTKQLTEVGPSVPVNISGFDKPPAAGEKFYVLDDIAEAREIAESRANQSRSDTLSISTPKVSFEAFQELLQSGKLGVAEDRVILNLIIRADARGSLEAIEKELGKLEHPEVELRILQRSVGGISVADVTLASASEAVIVGFNVIPDEAARMLADERKVEIRRYEIIYNLANDIKAIVEGRLKPEERVVELGRALVKQVFSISRVGTIAGCYVVQGSIERGCRMRVNRDGRTIGDYALDALRRHKDDVKEVPRGMECGIKLGGFNDIKQDDILEAYRVDEVARTLDD
jgi:translation initiation factor IF-2